MRAAKYGSCARSPPYLVDMPGLAPRCHNICMRIPQRAILLIGLVAVVAFTVSIFLLSSGQYQALATGVQAVGVLVALALGVSTLRADSKDRRVDRVIAYHSQMTGGELQLARQRLIEYLLDHASGGVLPVLSWTDLRSQSKLIAYADSTESPVRDAQRLLEYFEGVWGAHNSGATEDNLLFLLLGGYVTWWDRALSEADADLSRSLHEFAAWISAMASGVPESSRVVDWQESITRDFGALPSTEGSGQGGNGS